jgi:hypothetical protein
VAALATRVDFDPEWRRTTAFGLRGFLRPSSEATERVRRMAHFDGENNDWTRKARASATRRQPLPVHTDPRAWVAPTGDIPDVPFVSVLPDGSVIFARGTSAQNASSR